MASKAIRKFIHHQNLHTHLKNNTQILIVGIDNLRANQKKAISQSMQGQSKVVMCKHSLMKRSIAVHAPAVGNNAFLGVIPHMVGQVGLVFTERDPVEVSEVVDGCTMPPLFCSSMDIGMGSVWQWLIADHFDLLNVSK